MQVFEVQVVANGTASPPERTDLVAAESSHSRGWWRRHIWPVLNSKMNIGLIAAPAALVLAVSQSSPSVLFVLSLTALCPCAERLGYITEQLAMHTNDTLGGLLNATFGNVTELVISAFAIKSGLLRVVQLSLLGSVVSNLLLVLGTAFVVGGARFSVQTFSEQSSGVNTALLMLCAFGTLLPSTLQYTATEAIVGKSELLFSRLESLIMLAVYGALLFFQLYTHRDGLDSDGPARGDLADCLPPLAAAANARHSDNTTGPYKLLHGDADSATTCPDAELGHESAVGPQDGANLVDGIQSADIDDEDGEPELSLKACLCWLTVATLLISLLSSWIVNTIEKASAALAIPLPFLSTILIPIVGNAAEHFSAVVFAARNRMDLTMGIAVGSATQVFAMCIPLSVIFAWTIGQPLDLNFSAFETVVFLGSILLTIVVLQHQSAHWLKGTILLAGYAFLCVGFWLHRDPFLEQA